MPRPILRNLYCTICFEATKDVVLKHKTDRKIGINFCCVNYGFKKEGGNSLRDMEYSFRNCNMKPAKLSKEEDEPGNEQLDAIFKDLDKWLFNL